MSVTDFINNNSEIIFIALCISAYLLYKNKDKISKLIKRKPKQSAAILSYEQQKEYVENELKMIESESINLNNKLSSINTERSEEINKIEQTFNERYNRLKSDIELNKKKHTLKTQHLKMIKDSIEFNKMLENNI